MCSQCWGRPSTRSSGSETFIRACNVMRLVTGQTSSTHAGLLHRDLVPAEVVGVAQDALLAALSGVDNPVFTWK